MRLRFDVIRDLVGAKKKQSVRLNEIPSPSGEVGTMSVTEREG
jgi:hypothetical protein|tara:strand:+ start:533 stop:661 length:129 start_codon:yes stop_codon:yes gene_type:complete